MPGNVLLAFDTDGDTQRGDPGTVDARAGGAAQR